jgi:hypothetical protein
MGDAFGIVIIIAVIGGFFAYLYHWFNLRHKHQNISQQIRENEYLANAKIYDFITTCPIAIAENGYMGLKNMQMNDFKVVHIKDIRGFELRVNGKNVANVGGAIAGGLLFGGIGAIVGGSASNEKITSISLLFKTNDFNNPNLEIPLLLVPVLKSSPEYQKIETKIKDLISTLELVEKTVKNT